MTLFESQISHPMLKKAYAYLLSTRSGAVMPSRAALDPVAMSEWIENTELLDVVDAGETFRYRIASMRIEQIFQQRMHGRCLDDVFTGDVLAGTRRIFRHVADQRVAVLANHLLERNESVIATYERILVPLSKNGVDVDIIFGCIYKVADQRQAYEAQGADMKIISEHSFDVERVANPA